MHRLSHSLILLFSSKISLRATPWCKEKIIYIYLYNILILIEIVLPRELHHDLRQPHFSGDERSTTQRQAEPFIERLAHYAGAERDGLSRAHSPTRETPLGSRLTLLARASP
jgi:hypothetical protein